MYRFLPAVESEKGGGKFPAGVRPAYDILRSVLFLFLWLFSSPLKFHLRRRNSVFTSYHMYPPKKKKAYALFSTPGRETTKVDSRQRMYVQGKNMADVKIICRGDTPPLSWMPSPPRKPLPCPRRQSSGQPPPPRWPPACSEKKHTHRRSG